MIKFIQGTFLEEIKDKTLSYVLECFLKIPLFWYISIVIVFIVSVVMIRKRLATQKMSIVEIISRTVFPVYILFILTFTIFIRRTHPFAYYEFVPFWSYIEIIKNKRIDLVIDNLCNVVMFIPYGFLLMCQRSKSGVKTTFERFKFAIKTCLLFSFSIEIIQLISKHGCFEFDDVFHNLIGVLIGSLIYLIPYGIYTLIRGKVNK